MSSQPPTVLSVSLSPDHAFSKSPVPCITLIPNHGVEGDAHKGITVQHLSRVRNPKLVDGPNLRQVHLIQNEIIEEFDVKPADPGENITTTGIDLLALGQGTRLRFVDDEGQDGEAPCIRISGLRNPCPQIEKFRNGLQEKFIVRDQHRKIVGRKAGVMSVVEVGGNVRPGMRILVEKPTEHFPLECV